ncbi:MAG: acyl-CoA desaturase, partial [Acidobacteria bacterium]|nr:acyl-CoA desaturase [Acidobacteriota bacterium]
MQNEATIHRHNNPINWPMTLFMALFHVGAVAALFNFSWAALGVAVF